MRKDLGITTSGSRNYEKRSRDYEILSRNYDIVVPEEKEDIGNVIITVLIQKTEQNNHSQCMARTTRATA
jgi:hypothetical protein